MFGLWDWGLSWKFYVVGCANSPPPPLPRSVGWDVFWCMMLMGSRPLSSLSNRFCLGWVESFTSAHEVGKGEDAQAPNGSVQGLCWRNLPKERKQVQVGKDRQD